MQQIYKLHRIMYIKYVKTCFDLFSFVFHYKLTSTIDLTMNFRSYSVHVNHVLHRYMQLCVTLNTK